MDRAGNQIFLLTKFHNDRSFIIILKYVVIRIYCPIFLRLCRLDNSASKHDLQVLVSSRISKSFSSVNSPLELKEEN